MRPYGGKDEFAKSMAPGGRYGKWIRSHNAVIKINNIIFVYGGLSARYAGMPFGDINTNIVATLDGGKTGAATDQDGPLWCRGLWRSRAGRNAARP